MRTVISPGTQWPRGIDCHIDERIRSHPSQESEEEEVNYGQQSKNAARDRAAVSHESVQAFVHG